MQSKYKEITRLLKAMPAYVMCAGGRRGAARRQNRTSKEKLNQKTCAAMRKERAENTRKKTNTAAEEKHSLRQVVYKQQLTAPFRSENMENYIALLSGLVGAIIGALASIATIFIQSKTQDRREKIKLAVNLALEQYRCCTEIRRKI